MLHEVSSETGMPVQRLMRLVETDGALLGQLRLLRLQESEDISGHSENVYQDLLKFFQKLLGRKNSPTDLVVKIRRVLSI